MIVYGFWGPSRIGVCVINIYALCQLASKINPCDRIKMLLSQTHSGCICVMGDFNSIRHNSERVGNRAESFRGDLAAFDDFIRDAGLVDLPLNGRLFTYYNTDGTCNSMIDRVLINDNWLACWPSSCQRGIRRSLSDHCPLLLSINVKGWGPKPFRVVNTWLKHPGFKEFVAKK